MSQTQEIASLIQAADRLTQEVDSKIVNIDQRVAQFEADAQQIVAESASQLRVANVGLGQQPAQKIIISPNDDASILVEQAFASGMKSVTIDWEADGYERHWNRHIDIPIGCTLLILGPNSNVDYLGGEPRADRACYKKGQMGGTSQLGSPLIFRNLQPSNSTYPAREHFKVTDVTHLLTLQGNNILYFGEGTYLHDQGGMTPYMYGNSLIHIAAYRYGLVSYIVGGVHQTQFYLSGPLVNFTKGAAEAHVRIRAGDFQAVSSDGPILQADKGFRRLKNKGLAVSTELLNKQLYELTSEDTALLDNLHSGYTHYAVRANRHEISDGTFVPKIIGRMSWGYHTGHITAQFGHGIGTLSLANMTKIEGTTIYIGD